MKAEQIIKELESAKTTYMGHECNKYSTREIRSKIQTMAERNEISPAEYKRALDITFAAMWDGEKAQEYETLN